MCIPFHNTTMKTQAIVLTALISILVMGILFFLFYINYMLAKSRFQASSDYIYQRMNYQIISNYLYYNTLKIESTLNKNGDELIILNQVYLKLSEMVDDITINQDINMNFSGIQQIPQSIQSDFIYGDCFTSYSFLCYTNLTDWSVMSEQDLRGVKIQQHLQYFGQIIYQNSLTQQQFILGYTKPDQITFTYPCLHRGQKSYSYFPEQREWYLQALKLYNQGNYTNYKYTLTDPFILFTNQQQGISLAMPLVDKNINFIGALAITVVPQGLVRSVIPSESLTMVLLADSEGQLLVHSFQTDELIISINNTNLTGFNDDDWQQMISSEGKSNCKNLKNSKVLCRFNSLYQQDMHIGVTKLKYFNLYLIIIDDTTSFIEFQQQLMDRIDVSLKKLLFYVFLWGGFILIIILLLQLLKFVLILRPIYLLLHQAKKKYQHRSLVQLSSFQNLMTNDTIRRLIFQYNGLYSKLSSLNKNKSLYCKELEDEQQFPQFMQDHLPYEIKNSIDYLSDGKEFTWYYSSKSSSKYSRNFRLTPQPCIF